MWFADGVSDWIADCENYVMIGYYVIYAKQFHFDNSQVIHRSLTRQKIQLIARRVMTAL
jgi:hypothetical protein